METLFLSIIFAEIMSLCFGVAIVLSLRSRAARVEQAERQIEQHVVRLDRYMMTPEQLATLRRRIARLKPYQTADMADAHLQLTNDLFLRRRS